MLAQQHRRPRGVAPRDEPGLAHNAGAKRVMTNRPTHGVARSCNNRCTTLFVPPVGAHPAGRVLARWLLMMRDRSDDDALAITQTLLAGCSEANRHSGSQRVGTCRRDRARSTTSHNTGSRRMRPRPAPRPGDHGGARAQTATYDHACSFIALHARHCRHAPATPARP
jgi:hypothetical protein